MLVKAYADVAQSVEQLIRNQQVSGSSPLISSSARLCGRAFFCRYSSSVECKLPKLERRVRFPLPAPPKKSCRFNLQLFFYSFNYLAVYLFGNLCDELFN